MDHIVGKSGVVVEFHILDNGRQGEPHTHSNTSTSLRKWSNRLFTKFSNDMHNNFLMEITPNNVHCVDVFV